MTAPICFLNSQTKTAMRTTQASVCCRGTYGAKAAADFRAQDQNVIDGSFVIVRLGSNASFSGGTEHREVPAVAS